MNELDRIWNDMLADAAANARSSGRGDVADYLSLKSSNDEIRRQAVLWLFDSLISIAAEAGRHDPSITLEREEPHSFEFRGANIVGSLVRVRQGVRSLTVEAGWPRTPSDGFIRGNAMAVARVLHFGMKRSDADLLLVRHDDEKGPLWFAESTAGTRSEFRVEELLRHFAIFLGGP